MKITDFINKYTKATSAQLKDKLVEDIIEKDAYLSYAAKVSEANAIVAVSHLRASEEEENASIVINTPKQYLFMIHAYLKYYTKLEFETEEVIRWYDELNKIGALDKIIEKLPKKEVTEFKSIIDMTFDDFMANHQSLDAVLNRQIHNASEVIVGRLTTFIGGVIDIFTKNTDVIVPLIQTLQKEQTAEVVENGENNEADGVDE